MLNILKIFPKKQPLETISSKVAFWLSIALLVLLISETYSNISVKNEVTLLKAKPLVLDLLPPALDNKELLIQFEKGAFCGWQIDRNGTFESSQSFHKHGNILTKKFETETPTEINVCVNKYSAAGKIIFSLIAFSIIAFLTFKPQNNKNEQEVPTT